MKLRLSFRPISCPWCKAPIAWRHVGARFSCPSCHHGVRLQGAYFGTVYVLAIVAAGLLSYALGFRGDALFATTMLAILPTYWIMLLFNLSLFPPDTIQTGDYQAILYGPPAVDADDLASKLEITTPDRRVDAPDERGDATRPLLAVRPEPTSLEGWAIRLGVLVFLGYMVFMAAEPALYWLFPRFMGTRTGPSAFPITVVIEERGLSLTNGSTTPWTCTISTPRRPGSTLLTSLPVAVAARQTAPFPYTELGAHTPTEISELIVSLREDLRASCTDPTGRLFVKEFSGAGLPVRIREP